MSFNVSSSKLTFVLVVLLANANCGSVTDQKANAPTIAALTPDHGSAIGGIKVTITGTNFQAEPGDPLVIVNGTLATDAVATSDTEL
nr:IPT/TIG domain-containing protein [Kofleriaceae bacterium]